MYFDEFPALLCKSCSQPMWLPAPTHPSTSQRQPWWPRDMRPRIFLCPRCKHVFEYAAQEPRPLRPDEMDQTQAHKVRNVVCIEVPCGVQGSAALLKIHTLMARDAVLSEEAPAILSQAVAHNLPCGRGHILSGPCTGAGPVDAYFDQDWESAD